MRRLQLFEWEDQPWLPRVFRDFITDHLRFTHNEAMREPVNDVVARQLAKLLTRTGTSQVVDLCAGGGGPLPRIAELMRNYVNGPVDFLLTDRYPNIAAFTILEGQSGGRLTPRYDPIDATDVPPELEGVRTVFAALHHFPPAQVKLILADAVRKRAPIAVFEPLERTLRLMILVPVVSLVRGFILTPRIGPLRFDRFLVTYLLPVAPFILAWDGFVSALRTYTAGELLELATSVANEHYTWEAGRFETPGPFGRMPTTYLIGAPSPRA